MSTIRQRVIKNSLLNLIASVSQRIGHTLILIAIARLLSKTEVGSYTLANTYTSVLLPFSFWGLDQLLVREVARNKGVVGRYLRGFLGLRIALATLLWLALAMLLPFLSYTLLTKRMILIMAASIIPGTIINLYQSVWIAFEDMKAISLITLFFSLLRVTGGVALLLLDRPLEAIAYLILFVAIAEMAINVWITEVRHRPPRPRPALNLPFWIENLKLATPLILVTFILIIEYQFDVIILSMFRSEREVGIYGAAVTLLTALLFLSRSYQLAIFPVLSRAYHGDREQLQRIYSKSLVFLLVGATLVATLVTLSSRPIIRLIFASGYDQAAVILRVLVWAFVFSAFNVSNSRLLLIANQQRMMAVFAALSMSGNLLLSFWLVPRLGGLGSAWAKILAMPIYSILAFIYVQRHICPVDWRGWWKRQRPI